MGRSPLIKLKPASSAAERGSSACTQYPAAGEEQAAEHPLLSMTVNRLRQSSGSSPLPSSESSPLSASFVSMSNSRERISQNIRL